MEREDFPHADGDVSVVIVTYRNEDVLAACLTSFERFRPRRVGEVIVVDNGPDTDAPPLTDSFPWIEYDRVGANLHFRRGINRGVRRARLPYVFLLNPDTEVRDPDSIATLAAALDADSSVGFAGPKIAGADGRAAPQGERLAGFWSLVAAKSYLNAAWPSNPLTRRHRRIAASRDLSGPVDTLSAAALLCRRAEFLAVGGFDERATAYWEEQELARKMRARGLHGSYRADAFVFHRWRRGGTADEAAAVTARNFDEAMALYYREYAGRLCGAVFGVLDGYQRLVRRVRR